MAGRTVSAKAEARVSSPLNGERVQVRNASVRAMQALTLAAIILGTLAAARSYGNLDVSWYLHAAGRLLDGARLYRDVFDVNPPLVIHLGVPAAALSRVIGAPDIVVFNLMVAASAVVSLALIHAILTQEGEPPFTRGAIVALAAIALFLLPESHFGQREHVLTLALLPYILLSAARAGGTAASPWMPWVIGVLAGLGVSLKPQFIPTLVIIHGWAAYRGVRRFPPELGVACAFIAAYLLFIIAAAGDFFTFLPFGARYYTEFVRAPLLALLAAPAVPIVLVSASLALATLGHSRDVRLELLAIAAIFALFIAMAQQKGWDYHYYPALALSFVAAGVALARAASITPAGLRRGITTVALLLVSLMVIGSLPDRVPLAIGGSNVTGSTGFRLLAAKLADEPRTFATLSNTFEVSFPLVNRTGARWVLPVPSLWPLPGILAARAVNDASAAQVEADEIWFRDLIVTALTSDPPRILLVDERRDIAYGDRAFDYVRYLSADPRFADLMQRYARTTEVGGHAVYELLGTRQSEDE